MYNCPLLVPSPLRLNKQKRSTLTEEKTITVLSGHWTYPFNINASHSLPHTHTHIYIYSCPALCSENSGFRGEREEKRGEENAGKHSTVGCASSQEIGRALTHGAFQ